MAICKRATTSSMGELGTTTYTAGQAQIRSMAAQAMTSCTPITLHPQTRSQLIPAPTSCMAMMGTIRSTVRVATTRFMAAMPQQIRLHMTASYSTTRHPIQSRISPFLCKAQTIFRRSIAACTPPISTMASMLCSCILIRQRLMPMSPPGHRGTTP